MQVKLVNILTYVQILSYENSSLSHNSNRHAVIIHAHVHPAITRLQLSQCQPQEGVVTRQWGVVQLSLLGVTYR